MGTLFKYIDDVEIVQQMFPHYPVNDIQGSKSIMVNHFYQLTPVKTKFMPFFYDGIEIENDYVGWDVIVYPDSMEGEKEKIADGACFHDAIRAIYARMINNTLDSVFKQAKVRENRYAETLAKLESEK